MLERVGFRALVRVNARRGATLSLGALVTTLLLCSASAHAARDHVFSLSFGEKGGAVGQLSEPEGVAVNESSGDIYVVDKGNDRVEYFSSTGAYVGEFNGSGANPAVEGKAAPTGRFSEPGAIAIDNEQGSPSLGDVYVADVGNHMVDKFSASGEYIGQLSESSTGSEVGSINGLAVDGQGKLWVCQQEKEIDAFSDALENEFISRITSTGFLYGQVICGFAVDANDDIYNYSDYTGIGKLNSSGQLLIEEFNSLLKEFSGVPGPVAVDLGDGEVYVGNADDEGSIGRFTSGGKFVETFGSERLAASSGIAVDAATGEVYVADAAADRVEVFALEPEGHPTIESESASTVTASSTTLAAQIKPTGPDTTYYFQYCAVTPASCTDVPAAPGVDLGGGFEPQNVYVHLQGLQAATVYRFRAIAINELGVSEGAEKSFTTQAAGGEFALPDGRSWEMVTPPNKYGSDLIAVGNEQGADIQAADNGDAMTYGATAPFVLNPAGSRSPEVTQVFSTRTAPGTWSTADITTAHDEGAHDLAIGHSAEYKLFSPDLSAGLVEPWDTTPLPPLPPGSEKTIYLRMANGEYKALVTSTNTRPGAKFGGKSGVDEVVEFENATPDFKHIVLYSGVGLTSAPNDEGGLYEWTEGKLQLIGGGIGERLAGVRHALSNDGSRVVSANGDGHLYLRDTASGETVQVDAAQGAPEPLNAESQYHSADDTDSRIFFTSAQRLTPDSTASPEYPQAADLYEFEVTGGSEPLSGRLTDLTVDRNTGESADVRGVIGASEDGTYVYFVANGVLGDAGERGVKHGDCEHGHEVFKEDCNLYVERYDEGTRKWSAPNLIATLSGADRHTWENEGLVALKGMTSRVSPNGHYLAFMSERGFTGYENHDADSGVADEEVYLYDASTNRLVCASCNPSGARPVGKQMGQKYESNLIDYAENWRGRWLAASIPGWTTKDLLNSLYQSRYLSNSGRLFFNAADALVPADVNGNEDVYEYEPAGVGSCQGPGYGQSASDVFNETAGGCVGLISSGTSNEESAFMDASESGGDVFFMTESRLSPSDYDTSLDLYDAHECTTSSPCGPPVPLAPPPCTTGDACKAAPTPQPAIFGAPSSETFSGAGNILAAGSAPVTVTSRSATQKRKLAAALKACRKKPKQRRTACERRARKRYGAKGAGAGKNVSTKTGR